MADKRDVRSALRAYEQPSMLQGAWDEISGAFARYGRRSGAQRDASLAMLNQAVDPNTDPLTGAGMKALGLAGLVTHPLAFFPTGDEWRERTRNAGNTGRMGQAIGGMLGDLPGLIDPQLLAGGGVLAAAPLVGKLARQGKTLSHSELLARGADGHLSSAREMQIPVSKVVGREPTPAAAEGMPYVKGRPITQPIEVEYNAADDTYTLYAGNHRITQAELNGDEFIPAFVQGNGGKFGDLPSIVDPHLLAGGGALAAAPLVAKMAKPAAAVRVLPTDVTGYSRGESFGTKLLKVDDAPQAAADLSILGDTVYINNIETLDGSRRSGLASKLLDDIFAEFPNKKIAVTNMTDDGSNFFRKKYAIDEDGVLSRKEH